MAFGGSWLLEMSEIIIVSFLLGFIFVLLCPSSNAHIVDLVSFLCFYFDVLVIEGGYEALLINVMTKTNYLSLIQLFL